eukprot:TRINITY_DN82248_c0_g1_i1.p1 TRINITY_DN82248_c0_g1~~TRINITY_DN82248_c0_g1_i1.p1  ORF type:complete len:237 (-),score=51.74 TRINITY_DN82248_c0_g1_i1:44-754(-)
MYMQWRTPVTTIPSSKGLPRLFTDERYSTERRLKDAPIHEKNIIVVTDRHALAAHEHWQRKTKGRWVDPPSPADKQQEVHPSRSFQHPPYACSGKLLTLEREAPNVPPQFNIAVTSPVMLTIEFAAEDQVCDVDFAVVELSHSEYEVRVLSERRRFRKLAAGQELASKRELARLQEQLVGTPAAVGRVRTLDIVGGQCAANYRQAARREFDPEERRCRAQYFEQVRARSAARKQRQ